MGEFLLSNQERAVRLDVSVCISQRAECRFPLEETIGARISSKRRARLAEVSPDPPTAEAQIKTKQPGKKRSILFLFWQKRRRFSATVSPLEAGVMASNEPDNDGDLERVLSEGYLEEETAMDTDLSPEPGQQAGERDTAVVKTVGGYGNKKTPRLAVAMQRARYSTAARKPRCVALLSLLRAKPQGSSRSPSH